MSLLFANALGSDLIDFKAPRLGRVRLGDALDTAKQVIVAVLGIVQKYLTDQCQQDGVPAAKCTEFSQKATLIEQQMNDAFASGDLITLGILANQAYQLKKDIEDALAAAKVVTPPPPPPIPPSTFPYWTIPVGIGGLTVLGLIIWAVTK